MTWDELASALKTAPLLEMRGQKEKYLEVVVATEALPAVSDLLARYFGVPFKPEAARSFPEADAYAAPFGGIQAGQTLYIRKTAGLVHGAMLWPWGNGSAVTVKIFS